MITILSANIAIILLFLGIYDFVRGFTFQKAYTKYIIAALALIAIILYMPYRPGSSGPLERWFFRIGINSLIIGLFSIAGFFLMGKIDKQLKAVGYVLFRTFLMISAIANLTIVSSRFYYSLIDIESGINQTYVFIMTELLVAVMIGVSIVILLLEKQKYILISTNRQLDHFLYSTSHDLRAPIASILGLLNIMKIEKKYDETNQYVGMIEQRIQKLDSVIYDILNYARSNKQKVIKTKVNFDEIVQECIDIVQFNEGAGKIRFEYKKTGDPTLYSDRNLLKIITENIIGNAIKYHKTDQEDPWLLLTFVKGKYDICISIADNGTGIEESALENIFNMFYRGNTRVEGTGLGLYIVRESVSKLSGDIKVESKKGQGTTFTITLPV